MSESTEVILAHILEKQDDILAKIADLEQKLKDHMELEDSTLMTVRDSLPKKPDGTPDVEGHREYHQAIIEEARERKKLWRELRADMVKKGVWGFLFVLWTLFMYWWTHEIKR